MRVEIQKGQFDQRHLSVWAELPFNQIRKKGEFISKVKTIFLPHVERVSSGTSEISTNSYRFQIDVIAKSDQDGEFIERTLQNMVEFVAESMKIS